MAVSASPVALAGLKGALEPKHPRNIHTWEREASRGAWRSDRLGETAYNYTLQSPPPFRPRALPRLTHYFVSFSKSGTRTFLGLRFYPNLEADPAVRQRERHWRPRKSEELAKYLGPRTWILCLPLSILEL